jgi:FdhD protein
MERPVTKVRRRVYGETGITSGDRSIPEETAVALTYNGGTAAVMMASPTDLEDFATGFSLTEGIVSSAAAIRSLDVVPEADGIELRMWLDEADAGRLSERRRMLTGPTGCGLCGIDSLKEAVRPVAHVAGGARISPRQIMQAVASVVPAQALNHETRAVHAAAFWHPDPDRGLVALREDVGRHNALDKLCGALARQGINATGGIVVLTSRVSIEMVQKAAAMGAAIVAAVSAPTALAVRTADAAGITLVGIARADGFEVFTHGDRIVSEAAAHVA